LFDLTARYGLPYFQNFLNSDLEPQMVRSMCCRLQLDLRELLKRGNGLFGSAEQTGSLGVVTINWLGYRFKGNWPACWPKPTACWSWPAPAWKSSANGCKAGWMMACILTPSAIWARCAITSPPWG
jgi:hypothetical protein